jgi:hypothetical protein
MKARFLKGAKIKELVGNIKDNLDRYRTGGFDFIDIDPEFFFETDLVVDDQLLRSVACTSDDPCEVSCCINMLSALGDLSHYLARDERLWTYLTHTLLLNYARTRWPIPADDEKAVNHIKAHFFCIGARGIERDNAASRLWWMATLCNRSSGMTLNDALTCFLFQSDVRANIIERPTTSQNVTIFSAILAKLNESYKTDRALFGREKFRSVMKGLNLRGGVKLLAALPEKVISNILDECIAEAS